MSNDVVEKIIDFGVEKGIDLLPISDKTKVGLLIAYHLGKILFKAIPEIQRYRQQKEFREKLQRIEQDLAQLILAGDEHATEEYLHHSALSLSQQASILAALPYLERELRKQRDQITEWNQRLNKLIERKEFDEAVRFVQSLDVPAEERDRVVAAIRDMANSWQSLKTQIEGWNTRLQELLAQERLQDAVLFVRSLNIAEDEKRRIIRPIEEALQKQQWNHEILRRSEERKAREALDYLMSLPIEQQEKEATKFRLKEYWRTQVIRMGDRGEGDPRREAYYYLQTLPLFSNEEKEEFHMHLLDRWRRQDAAQR